MTEILASLLPFLVIGGIIVGSYVWQKKQAERLRAELANDREVEVSDDGGIFRRISVVTRRPLRAGTIQAAGGGKNNPARWDVTTTCPALSHRTTVSLSREGAFGSLREMIGMKDVHIGEEEFDRMACLRGSEADVVRGIFSRPDVQQATTNLFGDPQFWRLQVRADGSVGASFARRGVVADDIKEKLLLVVKLADALEAAASTPALSEPSSRVRTSAVGGSSGAPVSISIGERR